MRDAVDAFGVRDECTDRRTAKSCGTSAADLKFLLRLPRVRNRNFKSKAALKFQILLVPFAFRSSRKRGLRGRTNFGKRALDIPTLISSWRQCYALWPAMVTTSPAHQGEHEGNR
jgi:hypothetical protein